MTSYGIIVPFIALFPVRPCQHFAVQLGLYNLELIRSDGNFDKFVEAVWISEADRVIGVIVHELRVVAMHQGRR